MQYDASKYPASKLTPHWRKKLLERGIQRTLCNVAHSRAIQLANRHGGTPDFYEELEREKLWAELTGEKAP
jgi:hypothetical protein